MVDKSRLIAALTKWINQRPGLEFGNYGDVSLYRAEMRSITRARADALAMLRYVAWHDSITAEMILSEFRSGGRFTCAVHGDKVTLDYCVGQYWPTEYRRAACALLSSVIWAWLRENMPAPRLTGDVEWFHYADGEYLRTGDDIRRAAARELGRSIASRWFK